MLSVDAPVFCQDSFRIRPLQPSDPFFTGVISGLAEKILRMYCIRGSFKLHILFIFLSATPPNPALFVEGPFPFLPILYSIWPNVGKKYCATNWCTFFSALTGVHDVILTQFLSYITGKIQDALPAGNKEITSYRLMKRTF